MKTRVPIPGKIAVLGAGESGVAAARLLASKGAEPIVFDSACGEMIEKTARMLAGERISLHAGETISDAACAPNFYDAVVISPGIDPSLPLVQKFLDAGIPLVGELELAFQHCTVPVVAITGTNGKTTTTQLVEVMFNGAGVPTIACGNIGPTFSSKIQNPDNWAVMTVEVSSFQLERIEFFKPKIAVWLNLTADHLDRYPSMEAYYRAKARIFENQTESDWAVVKAGEKLPSIRAQKLTFSAHGVPADFMLQGDEIVFRGERILCLSDTRLRGRHNAENLMAALGVGHAWGLRWEQMRNSLQEYRALPHRCEWIRTLSGVEYFNDSKATNLDAMENALVSEQKPVVLIAGGKDKGFEFDSVTALVAQKCRAVVLIGEMAARIKAFWGQSVSCHVCEDLGQAVECARSLAQSGDVVLFSPGTSSFDMFQNYADRGNQFRQIVLELVDKKNVPMSEAAPFC